MNIRNIQNKAKGGLFAALSLLGSVAVHAQPTTPADSLQARLDELDQRIRVVARLNEIAQEDAKAAAAKQGKVNAGPGNLGFASADGAYSLRFSGFVQASGRYFTSDPATPQNNAHNLNLRRIQNDVRGTVYKNFGWRVHTNVAGNTLAVLDAQVDWNLLPEFNLSVGKFKPPTGLERLLASPRAPFIEGSFVTALQPNRDVGVQASGNFAKGLLQYQAGLFNGANDNQDNFTDVDNNRDLYVRVFSQPFVEGAEALKGLGAGVSASYGKHENGAGGLTAIPTPGRQSFSPFAATDTLDGTLFRVSPQAYYYAGPFGLIAEYTQTTASVRSGAHSADLTNSAWALTGSWVLTGEKNDYKGGPKVAKANNWPNGRDFGAVELLARVHGISIDDKAAGAYGPSNQNNGVQSALGAGAAVGWYLNNAVKLFASYEHTGFANVSAAPAERDAENVLSFSFNVAY